MKPRLERLEGAVAIRLPWRAEFRATNPPGRGSTDTILFVGVPRDYTVPPTGLRGALEEAAHSHGAPGALVFLTAVDPVERLRTLETRAGRGRAWVYATIGLEPPVCPGGSGAGYEPLRASTINVAVIVEESLSEAGALDLLRVVAEAKAAASSELLLRCPREARSWRPAGTVTDAIAVLWPPGRGSAETSGHATSIGGPVGGGVYRLLVEEGLHLLGARGLAANALGLSVDDLAGLVAAIYDRAPVPGVPRSRVISAAKRLLEAWLGDPNVQSLIIASRELDIHGAAGALPGLGGEEFRSDSKRVVSDELLGMALASYLAGARGILAMYWVERLKEEGVIPEAPMFEDDIVSALLGSAIARILDRLLGTEPEVII